MRFVVGLPALLFALVGCGFDLKAGSGGTADAARDDASIDAPVDAPIDTPTPIDAMVDATPALVCPASYTVTVTGSLSKYRIITTDGSFNTHHAACNADMSGSTHLVVFDTTAEIDAITALAASAQDPNDNRFFVGAVQRPNATAVDNGWFWFTGGAVPAEMWGSGHPDDDGDFIEADREQQLAAIDAGSRMNDVSGTIDYGAICECDGKALDPTAIALLP